MILRDLEFLRGAPAAGDLLIYRYRTGALRQRVKERIRLNAAAEGRELSSLGLDELNERWCMPDLFPATVICELSSERGSRLQTLLQSVASIQPARPTAIFVSVDKQAFSDPNIGGVPNVTVLEEHAINQANLLDHLTYCLEETDLRISRELLDDQAFVEHFVNLLAEGEINGIDELDREFDRAVLLNVDIASAK